MIRKLVAATAALALLVTSPVSAGQKVRPAASAKPQASAAVQVARVPYSYRKLANGLRIYAIQDKSSPNVSVQVWYNVGSKDDPAGRSGFAHLFEHMMFKATRNLPSESFDRLTEDVGGYNNASTNDDYTNYYEVAPANYLRTLLWAEAERMGALVVDEANFKSERDVVKEELRQRILAEPYGKLFGLYAPEISFEQSPYGRPGIGSIEDLDAATLKDVQAFHATYYRPDNAVMVVAGNFDQAELDRWIDQYFAPLETPKTPIPRVTVTEPARTAPKQWDVYEANTPLPAVVLSYPIPGAASPDLPALIVLDAILSKGESSRLYESLVYRQQIASEAFTSLEFRQGPSAYLIGAVLSEGKTPEAGEAGILKELARVRGGPVSAAELAEAKNQLITDTLETRETVDGKASELAQAVVMFGDPEAMNRLLPAIQKVTAADVERVARAYLTDNRRAVIRYRSDADKPAGAKTYGVASTVRAQALAVPADLKVITPAAPAERVAPPAPGEPLSFTPPKPAEKRLANGLRVVVSTDRDVPLVSAELVVPHGGAEDPHDLPGVASMTAALMTKGTKTRSATDIARQIEALGGAIEGDAGYDGSSLGLTVKRDQLDRAFDIFADVAMHPAFAEEELDRMRQQALDNLQVGLSDPGTLASYAAARAVYGDAPYGRPMGGTPGSLPRLKPADLVAYHANAWTPYGATLVIAGDISPEEGFALAERKFGGWKATAKEEVVVSTNDARAKRRVIVIDLPGSGQAAVAVTRQGVSRGDPLYYPTLLANSILGGGYSSRLNQEIRIKRGLSYGANSGIAYRRYAGPLIASTQTKNESAVEVLELMLGEMTRLGATAPGADELKARKAVVVGGFGRTVETTGDTAGLLGALALYGIDLSELGRYTDRVKAVTPEQVQAAGADVFAPDQASIVIVGDAKVFIDKLRAKYPDVEVIPAAELDLDSPTLRKR